MQRRRADSVSVRTLTEINDVGCVCYRDSKSTVYSKEVYVPCSPVSQLSVTVSLF